MKYRYAILLFAAVLAGCAHPRSHRVLVFDGPLRPTTIDQNDRYMSTVDAYVTARTGKVDPIVLVCAVTPNLGPNALFLRKAIWTHGHALTHRCKAQFIRVNRVSGGRGDRKSQLKN